MRVLKKILKKNKKKSIGIISAILVLAMFLTVGNFANKSSDTLAATDSETSSVSTKQNENNKNSATYKKDENIYGILGLDGKLNKIYVVNQFEVEKKGLIESFKNIGKRFTFGGEAPRTQRGSPCVSPPRHCPQPLSSWL